MKWRLFHITTRDKPGIDGRADERMDGRKWTEWEEGRDELDKGISKGWKYNHEKHIVVRQFPTKAHFSSSALSIRMQSRLKCRKSPLITMTALSPSSLPLSVSQSTYSSSIVMIRPTTPTFTQRRVTGLVIHSADIPVKQTQEGWSSHFQVYILTRQTDSNFSMQQTDQSSKASTWAHSSSSG